MSLVTVLTVFQDLCGDALTFFLLCEHCDLKEQRNLVRDICRS
jgi:GTPase SAR1 family protein